MSLLSCKIAIDCGCTFDVLKVFFFLDNLFILNILVPVFDMQEVL